MQCDVAIVGGGVMGASVAFWLTRMQPGLSVTVVERDPSHARAATALSLASIRQQFTNEVNVKISLYGIEFIKNIAHVAGQGGVSDLGLIENGYLFLTTSAEAATVMQDVAAMQRRLGAATEVLGRGVLAERFPWVNSEDLVAGSYGPRKEGWFDNMGLLGAFRGAARAQGALFLADEVTGIEQAGGRVTGLRLASGQAISCGAVVNAAGTRAAAVMAMVGLSLPVEPRKRTIFVIDAPNARHPDAPLLIDGGFYIRPERGHWLAASVPQDDKACDPNDFEPDLEIFEEVIWQPLYHRCPGFDAVKVVRHWVGHYEYNTLDQNAILGPHPGLPNLYLCNGFSGHGLQQSPAVGRGLAEHILTGGWQSIDLSDLSVDRVLAGRPFLERAVV